MRGDWNARQKKNQLFGLINNERGPGHESVD